jgi:hypothetical protein
MALRAVAMNEQLVDVLLGGPLDMPARRPAAGVPHAAERLDGRDETAAVLRAGGGSRAGGDRTPSRTLLLPLGDAGTPGGMVPCDDDLLERTLAFSGSYVSDDGHVTIRRSAAGSFEYSEARFVGQCHVCSRAGLIPSSGEPLADVRAAVQFVAAHDHGDLD